MKLIKVYIVLLALIVAVLYLNYKVCLLSDLTVQNGSNIHRLVGIVDKLADVVVADREGAK